jgi:hypothetical protein
VQTERRRVIERLNVYQELFKSQKYFYDFVDLSTENDVLLKICAKHTSGKNFCGLLADFIEVRVFD